MGSLHAQISWPHAIDSPTITQMAGAGERSLHIGVRPPADAHPARPGAATWVCRILEHDDLANDAFERTWAAVVEDRLRSPDCAALILRTRCPLECLDQHASNDKGSVSYLARRIARCH